MQLGHVALLEAIGCEPVSSPEQLSMAMLTCSHDWDVSRSILFDKRFLKLRLYFIGRKIVKHGYLSRLEHWREYLTLNTSLPKVVTDGDDASESGTPFLQLVRTTLISHCNYNPLTVMGTPYLQALWDYIAYWESKGTCDIYDESYLDDMKSMHEEFREKLKERGGLNGNR